MDRTAELSALTAKALRPIAAELGITGTSRMVKADIVSAIIAAEAATAPVTEVHGPTRADFLMSQSYDRIKAEQTPRNMPYGGHWSMSFPLAPGGDGNVMQGHADYCATWGHATETHGDVVLGHCPRCGDPLSAEQIEAKREELRNRMAAEVDAQIPAMLCDHGIDARRRCSICAEDTAEGVPPVLTPAPIDGDAAFRRGQERYAAEKAHDTITGRITRRVAEEDAPMVEVERTPVPEYFARQTRRGVETVVVLRTNAGRVHYRIIDAKTGRRSAPYYMRELTFRAQYIKVPS